VTGPWEVFDCRAGEPVYTVRWLWLARLLKRRSSWLDVARPGEGWVAPDPDAAALGLSAYREGVVK
jgi:hypothetical protein